MKKFLKIAGLVAVAGVLFAGVQYCKEYKYARNVYTVAEAAAYKELCGGEYPFKSAAQSAARSLVQDMNPLSLGLLVDYGSKEIAKTLKAEGRVEKFCTWGDSRKK